jgi:hypothetical protein
MSVLGITDESQVPVSTAQGKEVEKSEQKQGEQTPNKPDMFAEKFSSLAKKEKRILREKEEAKALRDVISRKEQEIAAREEKIKQFEALQSGSPIDKLKALGTSYDELTQWYLNNGNPTPELLAQKAVQEVEKFKTEQQESQKRAMEDQKKAAEAELGEVLDQFKESIGEFVTTKTEDYELINLFDQSALVYDTIEQYFNENQKILNIKEAADLVEQYLEDLVKKTTDTKKFKKLYQPEAQSNEKKVDPQTRTQTQTRTLSNNLTSSSAPSFLPAKTENERISRALAALDRK